IAADPPASQSAGTRNPVHLKIEIPAEGRPPIAADPPASRSAGPQNPVHLRIELQAGFPLRHLGSATHQVRARADEAARYVVTLADEAPTADRDFELTWEPDLGREPKAAVLTQEAGGETYALLMIVPPAAEVLPGSRLPRETVFVIDTSGSMAGTSIEGAKRALVLALTRLAPEDRFNVIEFNSRTRRLFADSRRALPGTVEEARRWVSRLEAQGGTEMLEALEAALEPAAGDAAVRQVLFITDGAVGNEDELFRFIQTHLGRSRLFPVGLGSAPNSHFMARAAEFGRGAFTYVATAAEVDEKMSALFRKLEAPVLANLELVWDDASAESWPSRIPDLYSGEPLVVVTRLCARRGGVTVRGERSSLPWAQRVELTDAVPHSGIDRLWARRKIASLADSDAAGANESVRREIVEVALAHHLVSSFTSLVAVDVSATVARGTVCEPRLIPVHVPAGWEDQAVFGELPATATPAPLFFIAGFALAAAAAAVALRRGGGAS
ncbi:MAG: VWA domain-containing protein, partial [Acidobacteriota bacterium]